MYTATVQKERIPAILWLTVPVFAIILFSTAGILQQSKETGVLTQSSSSSSQTCTPARLLYFNLQPSLYGRDGPLPEFNEVQALGVDATFANRNSTPAINAAVLAPYNILWLHGGCGGESYPLKPAEISAIKSFFTKGGSLILDAGDDEAGGDQGPAGADCQSRINAVSENLGVSFSGHVQYAQGNVCRPIRNSGSTLLDNISKIRRDSSGKMTIGPVTWGKAKPVFTGVIPETGEPVLAVLPPQDTDGGAIFSPQDQGLIEQCSGADGLLYKHILTYLNHPVDCAAPSVKTTVTPIAGGSCSLVQKSLYGSGAVQVPCPAGTVIMGGGWNNGAGDVFTESRPFEVGQGWQCTGNRQSADATCTAVCCDDTVYSSIVVERDGGLSDDLTPTCPNGSQLVSGGFIDAAIGKDQDTIAPRDDVNGWECYNDDSTGTTGSRCFALCAQRIIRGDVLTCQTKSLAAPQDAGVSVACPPNTFITGGGFKDMQGGNHDQDESMPLPTADGWACAKQGNTKTGTGANICYARCCSLPEGITDPGPVSSRAALSSSSSASGQTVLSSSSQAQAASFPSVGSSQAYVIPGYIPPPAGQNSPASAAPSSETSSAETTSFSSASIAVSSQEQAVVSSSAFPSSVASSSAQTTSQTVAFASVSSAAMQSSSAPIITSAFSTSVSSAAPMRCPQNACALGGDGYCSAYQATCAAIADAPCFVCLTASGTREMPVLASSMGYIPSVQVESSSVRSLPPVSSSSAAGITGSPVTAQILPPIVVSSGHAPVGATGPGTLAMMAAGASSGVALIRRGRRKEKR